MVYFEIIVTAICMFGAIFAATIGNIEYTVLCSVATLFYQREVHRSIDKM